MFKLLSFVLMLVCFTSPVTAREQVKIGAAHFLPFIDARQGEPIGGAIADLVVALNQIQTEFQFTIIRTSPKYRHREFSKGLHDLSMFDNIEWGWDKQQVEASESYLDGGEVYITLAVPERDEFQREEDDRDCGLPLRIR